MYNVDKLDQNVFVRFAREHDKEFIEKITGIRRKK